MEWKKKKKYLFKSMLSKSGTRNMLFAIFFGLLSLIVALKDGEMELLLVQVIWRHGDRSPTLTFASDPIKENRWKFGGGGFGQLSPIGMKQHLEFGKQLRKTYVDTGFLGARYSSKEVYFRSSDVNRTIISAMANIMGMYGQSNGSNIKDVDYPDVEGWPQGFVPIAVHTVDHDTDHTLVPHAPCDRQTQLWKMAKQSEEVRGFLTSPTVENLMKHLTLKCGEVVDADNLWIVQDAFKIEQRHLNEDLRRENKWFSDKLYGEITKVNNQIQLYNNGIYAKPIIMNNLDIGLELQKIRGGSMFNDLNMHMNIKFDCLNNNHRPQCSWVSGLKYYVYSAHDTTIYAFLSVMGIQTKVVGSGGGYPDYTAAAFIELWYNTTDKKPYFKMSYRASDLNPEIHPITHHIDACRGKTYCDLEVFRSYAARTKPDETMDKWCSVDPLTSAAALRSVLTIGPILISYIWSHI
ncbi:hypothetical protein RB195_020543 [Necator americanus]|uniref:acid phosphatase n=1 Tax=Necator americanus TaxID=51031 RepID=A0ABR1CJC8_NECAM